MDLSNFQKDGKSVQARGEFSRYDVLMILIVGGIMFWTCILSPVMMGD